MERMGTQFTIKCHPRLPSIRPRIFEMSSTSRAALGGPQEGVELKPLLAGVSQKVNDLFHGHPRS